MNNCGDCNECCIVFKIEDLNKEIHTPCEHLCEKGCGIYETRPDACRKFQCLYLISDWDESLRPDKSGIMIGHFPDGYKALRLKDEVNIEMIDKIKHLNTMKGIKIEGLDARNPTIKIDIEELNTHSTTEN